MEDDKLLKIHVFEIGPEVNGGKSLTLTTKFFSNGDPITQDEGVYLIQELTLQSYGNSATFTLCGNFTPETLRNLANQLDAERAKLVQINPRRL